MRRNHRVITPFALALAIGVIAAPAASGKPIVSAAGLPGAATSEEAGQGVRSQQAMDAATTAQASPVVRSQQAMDAATTAQASPVVRSQQAMDAATTGQSIQDVRSQPTMDAATAAFASPVQTTEETGFDWGDAGVGAFGVFGLALIAAGGLVLLQRRKGESLRGSQGSAVTS